MSKMSDEELVRFCHNEITHCRCVLEEGKRSPKRVCWLLDRFLNTLDLREAIAELRDKDPAMHSKILVIRAHYTGGHIYGGDSVDWERAEQAWTEIKRKLREFAEQRGKQKLVSLEETPAFFMNALQEIKCA